MNSTRKLASHNSMSYMPAKGKGFLMNIAERFSKCQDLTYKQQYAFGVRLFDLRIRFQETVPYFAHGIVEYCEVNAYQVLDFLNKKGDCIVNLVLENTSGIGESQNNAFAALCKECEEKYNTIRFMGGWSKYPGNHPVIYKFQKTSISYAEHYIVFKELNKAIDDIQHGKDINFSEITKHVGEFIAGPITAAKAQNPKSWSEWLNNAKTENTYLWIDFVEVGAPQSWVDTHPYIHAESEI